MSELSISAEHAVQAGSLITPPIPPHLAAVWGAFLYEGLMLNSRNRERSTRILELWSQGCIELINTVCESLPLLWKHIQPYWYESQGFPGVFEYEVVSILGEELGTHLLEHHGDLPSVHDIERIASELVVTFFSLGGTYDQSSDQEVQTERLINLHNRFTDRLIHLSGGAA